MLFSEEARFRREQIRQSPPYVEDAPGAALQRNPSRVLGDHALRLTLNNGHEMYTPVFASPDPLSDQENTLFVGFPGMFRRSGEYFGKYWNCIVSAGRAATSKLIVPSIVTVAEVTTRDFQQRVWQDERFLHDGQLNVPYFGLTHWKDGEAALNADIDPAVAPGAYDLFDATLEYAADHPEYDKVVFLTHSASAQMGHRAWFTRESAALDTLEARGTSVYTIASEASTYLWLGRTRPVPYAPEDEEEVNTWRYGTHDIPPTIRLTPGEIVHQLQCGRRPTIFLVGSEDTGLNRGTEKSVAALAQGADRYERHQNYQEHLQGIGAQSVRFAVVPGAAHSVSQVYGSPLGMQAMFHPEEFIATGPS